MLFWALNKKFFLSGLFLLTIRAFWYSASELTCVIYAKSLNAQPYIIQEYTRTQVYKLT